MAELIPVLIGCAGMMAVGLVLSVILPGRLWWSPGAKEDEAAAAEQEARVADRVRSRLEVIQTTERRVQNLPYAGRDRRLAAEVIVRVPQPLRTVS